MWGLIRWPTEFLRAWCWVPQASPPSAPIVTAGVTILSLTSGIPVFREWLKLSLPLMMGVSLTYADKWILSYYASSVPGGISRLNVAKNLFNAPMSILGSAAGAASLPFFAALFAQGRASDFANAVNRSVSRVVATALLAGAWMMALSEPLIGLFRGGRFSPADAADTSRYFTIFAVSIAMWSAQAIYSRSFYAAGNTLTPAIAGWCVTLISIPIYALLFQSMGVTGLAVASDIGMAISTITLAVLLHKYRLVHVQGLEYAELGRALLAAPACLRRSHLLPAKATSRKRTRRRLRRNRCRHRDLARDLWRSALRNRVEAAQAVDAHKSLERNPLARRGRIRERLSRKRHELLKAGVIIIYPAGANVVHPAVHTKLLVQDRLAYRGMGEQVVKLG